MRYLMGAIMLFSLYTVQGQDTLRTKFFSTEKLGADQIFLAKDPYDNTFVRQDNTLLKLSRYNTTEYTNPSQDTLSQVDLSQANSVLAFYHQSQSLFTLSKDLKQIKVIDFTLRFPNMNAVYISSASARRLWIVDNGQKTSIRLYNTVSLERHLVYTLQGENSKDYFSTLSHFFWVDKDNYLHGIDTKSNVVLEYLLPSDYDQMQILDNRRLIYLYQNNLYYLDIATDKVYPIALKDKRILGFFYNTQKLSIFVEQKINNYIIKLP